MVLNLSWDLQSKSSVNTKVNVSIGQIQMAYLYYVLNFGNYYTNESIFVTPPSKDVCK